MTDTSGDVVILDGGSATTLEKYGEDLSSSLWSAQVLDTNPSAIQRVHREFFEQGADVVITASYQACPEAYRENGYTFEHFWEMTQKSVRIAQQAALETSTTEWMGMVAGSVGPFGACLGDGSEYSGNYVDTMSLCDVNASHADPTRWSKENISPRQAEYCSASLRESRNGTKVNVEDLMAFHIPRIDALVAADCDMLAIETIPCIKEIEALCTLLKTRYPCIPAWLSMSCRDSTKLHSGENISEAVQVADQIAGNQIVAIGCNCVHPKFVTGILETIQSVKSPHISSEGNTLASMEKMSPAQALKATCSRIRKGTSSKYPCGAGTVIQTLYPRVFPFLRRACVAYPNSGEIWDDDNEKWVCEQDTPSMESFSQEAFRFRTAGAAMVGGCCRTTPEYIGYLRQALKCAGK